jgi:hypothetical protein
MYLRSCMDGDAQDPSEVLMQRDEEVSLHLAIAEEKQQLQAALNADAGTASHGWLTSLLQVCGTWRRRWLGGLCMGRRHSSKKGARLLQLYSSRRATSVQRAGYHCQDMGRV